VAVAVISSVVKRMKKANNQQSQNNKQVNKPMGDPYRKPSTTQPKSLEDILQTLLNEQKPTQKTPPPVYQETFKADKELVNSTTLETTESLESIEEEKYYGFDSELAYDNEEVDFDKIVDHRNHGKGFDLESIAEIEEESEWTNVDWKKAVITAEILRRPEY